MQNTDQNKKYWHTNATKNVEKIMTKMFWYYLKISKNKNNSKYLTGYLDEVIRALVLMLPKVSGYNKTFKDKDGNKTKNNKLISLCIDDINHSD